MKDEDVKSGGFRCYDCDQHGGDYMVHTGVWLQAMPDYPERKRILVQRHPGNVPERHILLCFACLEARLGRPLTVDDFKLSIPINHGILLGLRLGRHVGFGGALKNEGEFTPKAAPTPEEVAEAYTDLLEQWIRLEVVLRFRPHTLSVEQAQQHMAHVDYLQLQATRQLRMEEENQRLEVQLRLCEARLKEVHAKLATQETDEAV